MKKFLSLVCIIAALSLLPSCTQKKTAGEYDSAADFRAEEGDIYDSVPNERYENYVFRILNAVTASEASSLDTETIAGNNLNEALYRRNSNVEERLGITIEEVRDTPELVFDTAVAACLSGENTYSAVCNTADNMATMAVCGYLVTDSYLDGIDLTKPWWNFSAIEGASVDGAYFFFFGDLQLSYYDAHSMVGVNMDMIADIDGLSDPYGLVDRGQWTVDRMYRMMQSAEADLDGNGERSWEDRYGTCVDDSMVLSLVMGCDTSISARDDYGLPYISAFDDEKFYDAFKLISDSFYERCDFIYDTKKNEKDGMTAASQFKEGRSLFYITTVGQLSSLRDMDYEFGVLPMPKYSTDQKDYVSFLSAKNALAIGVMATGRNLLRTGNILENMAAESHREGGLVDCYVDTVLSFRYVNDEKSRENLNTVLASGVFDPCEMYGWGGVSDKLIELAGDSDTFSSTMASVRLMAISDISDTVEEVNKHKK